MSLKKTFLVFLSVFALILLLWGAGYGYFVYRITTMTPPVTDGNTDIRTDAIIVVTGGSSRINEGLDLLQEGRTNNLFISGVHEKVSLPTLFSMWDGYEENKRPCCITLGHIAQNTQENALETRSWLDAQGNIKDIWLITSNYHIPRAFLELQHSLPEIRITPYPVESRVTVKEQGGFWLVSMREYNKTLLTYARLKLAPSLEPAIDVEGERL